jgi:hypothetical protein
MTPKILLISRRFYTFLGTLTLPKENDVESDEKNELTELGEKPPILEQKNMYMYVIENLENKVKTLEGQLLKNEEKAHFGSKKDDISKYIKTMLNMIVNYTLENCHEEAIISLETLLKFLDTTTEKCSEESLCDPYIIMTLDSLMAIYLDKDKNKDEDEDKVAYLNQTLLNIYEKMFDESHLNIAKILENQASLFEKCGNDAVAEILRRRLLTIKKQKFDENHPEVAEQLIHLAELCKKMGRYDEFEQYSREAKEIYKNKFGSDDSRVQEISKNLSTGYKFQMEAPSQSSSVNKEAITDSTLSQNKNNCGFESESLEKASDKLGKSGESSEESALLDEAEDKQLTHSPCSSIDFKAWDPPPQTVKSVEEKIAKKITQPTNRETEVYKFGPDDSKNLSTDFKFQKEPPIQGSNASKEANTESSLSQNINNCRFESESLEKAIDKLGKSGEPKLEKSEEEKLTHRPGFHIDFKVLDSPVQRVKRAEGKNPEKNNPTSY